MKIRFVGYIPQYAKWPFWTMAFRYVGAPRNHARKVIIGPFHFVTGSP